MPKRAGPGPGTGRSNRAGPENEFAGPGSNVLSRAAAAALVLACVTTPSLAQEGGESPAVIPEIYINNELLERLAKEPSTAGADPEPQPRALLQAPPDWQLESRIYVAPFGGAGPAEPAQAPPAPSVLTTELEALEGGRSGAERKKAAVVKPRDVPPRPAKPAATAAKEAEAVSATPMPEAKAVQEADSASAPVPAEAPIPAEVPVPFEAPVTAEVPPPAKSPAAAEASIPAEPPVTAEVPALSEMPGDAMPLTPKAPATTVEPPPPAPSVDVPAAEAPSAPPAPAAILDELAEAAQRQAPRPSKVTAPPVPEPPVPPASESVATDDQAIAARPPVSDPPSQGPEERLGPAAPTAGASADAETQLSARPLAQVPFQGQILFEAGSTELSPEARVVLDGLARRLLAAEAEAVELRAYATGRDPRRLSLSRGLVARSYLEKLGIEAEKVFLRPLGDKAAEGPAERIDYELVTR